MDKLHLGPWFGPGPVPPTWSLEALYAGGRDRFEVTHTPVEPSELQSEVIANAGLEATRDGQNQTLDGVAELTTRS